MSRPHEDGSPQQSLRFAADHVSLPKNKSTGNLLAQGRQHPHPAVSTTGKRSSFDAGQLDRMARSPIVPEHEHGLGASGLRRIRQQPPRLAPGASGLSSRAASLTINPTPPASRRPSGAAPSPSAPSSPIEEFGEDLHRFPTESLHSFSFATQAEEFAQNRQNVLKRSIDFMRDRLGWAASNPGIANAQAKLSGDQEVQSMLELLTRANLIGQDAVGAHGLGAAGPVTGPADLSGENIFEKTLLQVRSESPDSFLRAEEDGDQAAALSEATSPPQSEHGTDAAPAIRPPPRSVLKRTLTDVAPLSIQSQLHDALAQPYLVGDQAQSNPAASPSVISTSGPLTFASGATPHSAGAHGPGNRWAPANQAIFTTLATAPWTITAANDLACLVFGVTRSEVRKIGILEVVREERRKWLEEKLSNPRIGSKVAAQEAPPPPPPSSNTSTLRVGNGVTAKLLSKPSSRQVAQSRRAKTDDGSGSTYANRDKTKRNLHHEQKGSRGVLLCGDVVPILKRNGATGAASLWVKEKRGGLIWVLEEIAEDVVEINVDELGCVWQGKGAIEAVFGTERLRRGMDLKRLIPGIIRIEGTNTGALDYDAIDETRYFTAHTSNSINIPVTVEAVHNEPTFRISSFPHIAGIVVLSAQDLHIASTNSVFSSALFGQPRPEGFHINDLLPGFDSILKVMTDEDNIELVDGIVIPEHSFRRARALLAIREGRADAAAIFLRPSGLPALHRDGNEIMVDVQMRVVRNAPSIRVSEEVIAEEGATSPPKPPSQDLVYALWITYSRHLHASNHGLGQLMPVVSRPATPPHQPSPGQSLLASPEPTHHPTTSDDPKTATSLLTKQIQEAAAREIASPAEPQAKQLHEPPKSDDPPKKKTIDDFVVLEDMGQGAYGQVKLCRSKKNPSTVSVIKYVTKRRILVDTWTRDRVLGTVPLEIHVLSYLSRPEFQHPNIVLMTAFWEDDVNYYIEMAPHGLPGMDLFDYIELRVDMGEEECRRIFRQVASAVGWLHGRARVVHRDIKDENVVLDGEGRCRLVDFGSAQYVKNGPFDVFVGTIDYAAPEVLTGHPYRGREQDVWALGILLYTIIYKENPFYSIDEITDHDLRVPWVMSESSIELIRRMLDRDVERRITIGGVLESEWVRADGGEEIA